MICTELSNTSLVHVSYLDIVALCMDMKLRTQLNPTSQPNLIVFLAFTFEVFNKDSKNKKM